MERLLANLEPAALKARLLGNISSLFGAILILICFYILYRLISFLLKRILKRTRIEKVLINIIDTILRVVLLIVALIMVAKLFGINVSSALAGIGVVGIAIGFAAQDTLSNIIAGFLIFIDKPFRVGDYITYADEYGRIEEITIRSTRIRTQDNTYVVIPNQKIINEVLIDHSSKGDTRVVITVGIAYKESIKEAREAILKKVATINGILKTPASDVVVDQLADSSVKLQVRVWIGDAAIERRIHFATTEAVKEALDEAGIEIAYPHLQIVMGDTKKDAIDKIRS